MIRTLGFSRLIPEDRKVGCVAVSRARPSNSQPTPPENWSLFSRQRSTSSDFASTPSPAKPRPMPATASRTMADKAAEYGLSAAEYAVIVQRLNREPNDVELGVFSVMWSEHCSYKS